VSGEVGDGKDQRIAQLEAELRAERSRREFDSFVSLSVLGLLVTSRSTIFGVNGAAWLLLLLVPAFCVLAWRKRVESRALRTEQMAQRAADAREIDAVQAELDAFDMARTRARRHPHPAASHSTQRNALPEP
jgi:hypothetical protein